MEARQEAVKAHRPKANRKAEASAHQEPKVAAEARHQACPIGSGEFRPAFRRPNYQSPEVAVEAHLGIRHQSRLARRGKYPEEEAHREAPKVAPVLEAAGHRPEEAEARPEVTKARPESEDPEVVHHRHHRELLASPVRGLAGCKSGPDVRPELEMEMAFCGDELALCPELV